MNNLVVQLACGDRLFGVYIYMDYSWSLTTGQEFCYLLHCHLSCRLYGIETIGWYLTQLYGI